MTEEEWAEAEGVAALDHYDRAGDPADLRVAERVLGKVLAGRPDHPDRFRWAARRPDEVLDWVGSRPAGGAVLHFACHGAVDPRRPADAHLVLADHAGLTARTLLESSHHAELDVREVFLAACTTSVSGHDHDEVLSLASSFLAAGAHTVFGSLWPVPDGTTSLLMFKVHGYLRMDGYLRMGGLPPADALRQAQLWMLAPDRDVSDVPPELLQNYRAGMEFSLTSWAGFTHIGRWRRFPCSFFDPGLAELEVQAPSAPPGDGGVGWEAGSA